MTASSARRGTLLVVVLGLITIFLALMLAITVRVYNSTKSGTTLQQNVQAYLMLQAAEMVIDGAIRSLPSAAFETATFPLTAGDETDLSNPSKGNKPFGDILGWCRIQRDTAGDPSGNTFYVIAAGGSSAAGGAKTAVNSGDPMRNAYEIRYYWKLVFDPAKNGSAGNPKFTVTLQPVTDNANYKWN